MTMTFLTFPELLLVVPVISAFKNLAKCNTWKHFAGKSSSVAQILHDKAETNPALGFSLLHDLKLFLLTFVIFIKCFIRYETLD